MSTLESGRFFLPGPTEVHPDVAAAQTGEMIGHRGPAIQDLIARIDAGLKPVFQTSRPVIVSTSSATGLMEAAIRNGVLGGAVLSLVNGAFSGRFAEIGRSCGFDVDVWEVPWGEVHSPAELADRLGAARYDAVTLSQSETSTGALQGLEAIAAVVSEHDDTLLLVDSVTGIGGVETYPDLWGIDFILTGSQKALALPPGLAFGVASEAMLERSREAEGRGWYFALDRLFDQLKSNQTPATPAISLLYALDVQLKRISEEGMAARWARHLDMQRRTFDWVGEMRSNGVDIDVFASEGHRSPTVTCVVTPGGSGASEVVAAVSAQGWVVGGGYGKLKDSTIRIGHMGDHTVDELDGLLEVVAGAIG
ncbi:MAG: alanine--glyoxylate aminotransferase family protein [Acidimicrobiia bacterium]